MANPDNDSKIITQFLNNTQNTHRAIVSNSVGMAVLGLKKNYLKAPHTEADITAIYDHAIEAIKLNAKDNFFRSTAVDFLISAAQEPLNEYDSVHLYLPGKDQVFQKQTHLTPLTHVIPLVWLALKDHEKFAHDINYPALSKEQQFTRARGEYNKRLDNFFSLLIEFRNNNLCHQGMRNELVFLLNKIYAGIEVIEDDLSTIAATLKDHTNNLFWEHYKNAATTPAIKKSLTDALFIWMGEYNPKPLLAYVDPENTAYALLHALFIRHGSDPVEMNLKELIDDCLPTLNFSYDLEQFPVIQWIENIFVSAEENNSEAINPAIENMKKWIKTHVVLENTQHTENIREFNTLYQIYKSFDQRMQSLLEVTGNMQENYLAWRKTCEDYFTVLANAELSNEFPIAPSDLYANALRLKLNIDKFKSDRMVDQIENFFARWNILREQVFTMKYFYRLFLEVELFQKKALLTEAEIETFLKAATEVTDVLHITVFEINRIFLHAIIIEPEDWSDKFSQAFSLAFDFVRNNLNDGDSNINTNLMKTSYSTQLIAHLSYLHARFNVKKGLISFSELKTDSNSGSYIFLPHQVKTVVQWLWLSWWVNEELLLEIYQPQAVRINKHISTWLITNLPNALASPVEWLSGALHALPISYRNILFKNPEVVEALGIAFESRRPALVELINRRMPAAERIDCWETLRGLLTLNLDFYKDDVGISTVTTILDKLPANDRLRFLTIFSSPTADNILLAPHYFNIWFASLSGENLLTYLKQLDLDYLFEKFKSNADRREVKFKDKLPLPQRIELLKHLSSKFTSELFQKELLSFIVYIKLSFVDESIKLLRYLSIVEDTVDLTKLTTDFDYWQTTLKNIPAEKRLGFIIIFGNAQYLFLTPHLNVIADNLTANEFYFYAIAKPNKPMLSPYLEYNPTVCISHLISKLPESKRFEVLSYTYDARIATQSNVLAILKTLPIASKWAFLKIAQKFNAEIFTHLIAVDLMEWKAIEKTILFSESDNIPYIYRNFLTTFVKIYTALRAGQTSLFKSDMKHQHNSFDFIMDYAEKHPRSRSAKTLSLMKKYSNYRDRNIDLMTEIYVYGFSKSGIFKRSHTPYDGYVYTTNGVKQRLTWGEPIFGMFGYRNSRRGKIENAMDNGSNPPYLVRSRTPA